MGPNVKYQYGHFVNRRIVSCLDLFQHDLYGISVMQISTERNLNLSANAISTRRTFIINAYLICI